MGTLLIQSGQVAGQYASNPQQPGLLSIGFNFGLAALAVAVALFAPRTAKLAVAAWMAAP